MKTALIINDVPVELAYSWEELSCQQYFDVIRSQDDVGAFAALTGIDAGICKQMQPDVLKTILEPVRKFMQEEIPVYEIKSVAGKTAPEDIGKKEYARKANVDYYSKKVSQVELLFKISCIYLAAGIEDEDITAVENELLKEKFTDVISIGSDLFKNYILLCKSESKIPAPEYEPEELQAGVKDFQKYGVHGLVRSIALRWGISTDDVYKWPYNKVILEIRITADENSYERRLRRILSPKK